jgi:hypothetical protein
VTEEVLFKAERVTITPSLIMIDGASLMLSSVTGVRVVEKMRYGVGTWLFALLMTGGGSCVANEAMVARSEPVMMVGGMASLVGVCTLLVLLGSLFGRVHQVVATTVGGEVVLGNPGAKAWADAAAAAIMSAVAQTR